VGSNGTGVSGTLENLVGKGSSDTISLTRMLIGP